MADYKPNSHKSKEELNNPTPDKKVEKVITGSAKLKKKNEIQKFADVFISEDVSNVKSYILLDVLIPALKKAIFDIVTNGIDMILYGEGGMAKKNSSASKVSYRSYYDKNDGRRNYNSPRTRGGCDYDDIIVDTRGEAEKILYGLDEIISMYGVATVLDMYDLADITSDNYMHNKYGWTDIRSADIMRVREGYLIKMPKALPTNQ